MRVQETDEIYDRVEKSRVEKFVAEALLSDNYFRKASLDEPD
jgi:hypothetical protein